MTASEFGQHGIHTDLIFPVAGDDRKLVSTGRDITDYYGIRSTAFDEGVNLVPYSTTPFIRGNIRKPVHAVRAAIFSRSGNYDAIYTRDPFPLFTALLSGGNVIFETYRYDFNTLKRFALWRSFCYSRSNLVGLVTHSELSKRSFTQAGVNPDRLIVAHNGYSPDAMGPRLTKDQARDKAGLPRHDTIITYTGHVDPRKGVDILVAIAKESPEFRFLVVGHLPESSASRWFSQLISESGVNNVTLVPRVAPSRVAEYLYAADCLIIPPTAKPLLSHRRTVLPLKTFRYLAAGRPIVAPRLPDLCEVLRDGHNALLVEPDSPIQAAAALRQLLSNPTLQDALGRNSLADSKRYTWQARAGTIASFLRARVGPRR